MPNNPTQSGHTIVRNTSGVTMYFDFLGRHGATLTSGQDALIPGNVFTMWMNDPQKLAALNSALQAGRLEVLKTPDVFVWDTAAGAVKVLASSSASASVTIPDYGSYAGSAPSV